MPEDESRAERALYPAIEVWLRKLLETRFRTVHLEITAGGRFSDALQGQIDSYRDLVFSFLREAAPDLAGFVKKDAAAGLVEFVVIEVKPRPIKLEDIYQVRRYAELFDARYALLVSPAGIPERLMRLSKVAVPSLLTIPSPKKLTLVQFGEGGNSVDWFPDDPFG